MNPQSFNDDLLCLNLKDFADRLEEFLLVEREFVNGSVVLGLSAPFGSGKTTFLDMWENSLPVTRPDWGVVRLNAWESDYYGDPLFAIISELIKVLPRQNELVNRVKEAAKDIGWFVAATSNQVVNHVVGVNFVEVGESAKRKKAERAEARSIPLNAFTAFEARKEAMGKLKVALREALTSRSGPVLFLVDELDRCRPDYAVSYLEAIKHIFDLDGAIFVLAADRHHLENSARSAFGPNLDFPEYYRKFVHREVCLPPIQDEGYDKIALAYADRFLQRENLRSCGFQLNAGSFRRITELLSALKMLPRQIEDVFRLLGHVLSRTDAGHTAKLTEGAGICTIACSAFRIANHPLYALLGTEKCEPRDCFVRLAELLKYPTSTEWWFKMLLCSDGMPRADTESRNDICAKIFGRDGNHRLEQFEAAWQHSGTDGYARVRKKIEEIDRWL